MPPRSFYRTIWMNKKEKLTFEPADGSGAAEFYILAQTVSDGRTYLLVTDEDPESDEDGDAYILRDDTPEDAAEALYTMVDEDEEFERVGGIFQTLLDEEDIDLYPTEDEDL